VYFRHSRALGIGIGVWASATLLIISVGPVHVPFAASPWRWLLLVLIGIAAFALGAFLHRWRVEHRPDDALAGMRLRVRWPSWGSSPMGILLLVLGCGYPRHDPEQVGPLAASLLFAYGTLLLGSLRGPGDLQTRRLEQGADRELPMHRRAARARPQAPPFNRSCSAAEPSASRSAYGPGSDRQGPDLLRYYGDPS